MADSNYEKRNRRDALTERIRRTCEQMGWTFQATGRSVWIDDVLDQDPPPSACSLLVPGIAYLVTVLACYWIVRSPTPAGFLSLVLA